MDVSLTLYSKVIRSSLPGRLRLRLPMLKGADPETTKFVSDWLKSHASSIEVIVNPRVGSALITWDPAHESLDIESLLNEAVDYLQTAQALGLIAHQELESQPLKVTSFKKWKNILSSQGGQMGNRLLDALSPWLAADVKQNARKRRDAGEPSRQHRYVGYIKLKKPCYFRYRFHRAFKRSPTATPKSTLEERHA